MTKNKREPRLRIWFKPASREVKTFYRPVDSPEEAKKILASLFRYHTFLISEAFLTSTPRSRYQCRYGLEVDEIVPGGTDSTEWYEWESEYGESIGDYEPPEKKTQTSGVIDFIFGNSEKIIDAGGKMESFIKVVDEAFGLSVPLIKEMSGELRKGIALDVKSGLIAGAVLDKRLGNLKAKELRAVGELAEKIILGEME